MRYAKWSNKWSRCASCGKTEGQHCDDPWIAKKGNCWEFIPKEPKGELK